MIHHQVIQGSEAWRNLRLGIPTASEFGRIITAKKWDLAAGRHGYGIQLVTERILGVPLTTVTTAAMQIGHEWEPKAVAAYELEMGIDTEICGFCTDDHHLYGASPDRFVGEDGSVEIKNHEKPEIHVGFLFKPDDLKEEHFVQCQAQMYVTGRAWTDLISYFPGLPMVRLRVTPHEEFQKKLAANLKLFLDELDARVSIAKDRGWIKERVVEAADHSPDWVSPQDVEDILAAQRRTNG